MRKVNFKYKNGSERLMRKDHADILKKLGRGSYVTKVVSEGSAVGVDSPGGDLDSLELDELRELAQERGLKVHHNAGKERIIAALREEK